MENIDKLNRDLALTADESDFLLSAAKFLEHPGAMARGMNWFGTRIEAGEKLLSPRVRGIISSASRNAIEKALHWTLKTVNEGTEELSFDDALKKTTRSGRLHIGAAGAIGVAGGFFGIAALPLELPIITGVILRTIADTARAHGHNLNSVEGRLELLHIFSMGNRKSDDDALNSSYYSARIGLAGLVSEASSFIAAGSAREMLALAKGESAPIIVNLITRVAAQFEIQVTRKFLAQAAPVIGALGGGAVNAWFASYFHDCAKYHFGIKQLEVKYGQERVRGEYILAAALVSDRLKIEVIP